MMDVRGLFQRAVKDFERAKMNARTRNYTEASTLYKRSARDLLEALFISTRRKNPPKNASITYLSTKVGAARVVSADLGEILSDDERRSLEDEGAHVFEENGKISDKETFVRSLIGYAWAKLNSH
jgi:HEPN domain-containing protein